MSKDGTKVLVIYNQKGGVSKTTTAINVACTFGEAMNKNCLLIDFDAQGSATLMSNLPNWDDDFPNIGNLIEPFATKGIIPDIDEILSCVHRGTYTKNVRIPKTVAWEKKEFEYPFDILPVCGTSLSIGELAIHSRDSFIYKHVEYSFFMLKIIVDKIVEECNYDYIIIDANPSLSCFAINSLVASDFLIIPTTMTVEAISGINAILKRLKELNMWIPYFYVLGILYQRYDGSRTLDKQILDETEFNEFDTKIPDVNTKISKSISEGIIPVMRHDKAYEKIRNAYIDLCHEIEERIANYEDEHGKIQRKEVM